MAVVFDPQTGLSASPGADVRNQIAAMFRQAFAKDGALDLNVEPETPAGQLIDGITAIIIAKDNEIMRLGNMFNPRTATGVWQDALAKIYFIERRLSQPTLVTCLCRGLAGTVIPRGALVQTDDETQFRAVDAYTIGAGGTVSGIFSCETPGAVPVGAGAVTKIVDVVPGWDSVTNPTAGVMGAAEESQADFEARRYASVAKNSHGLLESVGGSIANLPGVVSSRIIQNRGDEPVEMLGVTVPAHSVYLSVYGAAAEAVGAVFYHKLDAGCGTCGNKVIKYYDAETDAVCTFYYTVPTPVAVSVRVSYYAGAQYDAAAFTAYILNNFNGQLENLPRPQIGGQLFASRFYASLTRLEQSYINDFQVSRDGGTTWGNVVNFTMRELPVLDMADISFVNVGALPAFEASAAGDLSGGGEL